MRNQLNKDKDGLILMTFSGLLLSSHLLERRRDSNILRLVALPNIIQTKDHKNQSYEVQNA